MSTFRLKRILTALAFASGLPLALGGCWGGGGDDGTAAAFSVGGSVAGLTSAGLVLTDGNDTTSVAIGATSFTFPTALAAGASYAVTVQTQPANATCVVSSGSGTVGNGAVTGIAITCTLRAFSVGGSITGLAAPGLVLANGADSVTPAAGATGFTLPTPVALGAGYAVTVQTQPAGEHCSLTNANGTIAGANVANVAVACAAASHSLGGTITGLPSAGLVLANGTDTVSPAAGALAFTFPMQVAEGGAYAVSVRTQPAGATCSVGMGTGTMGTSDSASVQVTCSANAYRLSGTITGLTASGLILANGTDTVSPAANATSFAFARTVAFGGSYGVTVQQQPAGQTCSVAGTFPAIIGTADVTDIAVLCAAPTAFLLVAGKESCFPNDSADGTGSNATLPLPQSIALDAVGNIFVMSGVDTVRRVTPAGVVTTIAGVPFQVGSVDGTGAAASFGGPFLGSTIDASGNFLIADNSTIRRVTPMGQVTTIAGTAVTYGFADGTGAQARFGNVDQIVFDSAGNLYVADGNNNAIRKVTPAGVVTTFAGPQPPTGFAGFVDGPAAVARFSHPFGLAIDTAGNLYVGDRGNNAIRKIAPDGTVSTLAGGGPNNPGFVDGTGALARFYTLTLVVMGAGGNLYVHDQDAPGGQNGAVRIVSPAGVVTTLAISDSISPPPGPGPRPTASLHYPFALWSIATDATGALFTSIGCAIERVGP